MTEEVEMGPVGQLGQVFGITEPALKLLLGVLAGKYLLWTIECILHKKSINKNSPIVQFIYML